jgi:hypothetical protein
MHFSSTKVFTRSRVLLAFSLTLLAAFKYVSVEQLDVDGETNNDWYSRRHCWILDGENLERSDVKLLKRG